jgi:hypothetical protein
MSRVEVSPQEFHLVQFDSGEIEAITAELADKLGMGDRAIEIEVDERTPLGTSVLESIDPIRIKVESGAFEDAKRLRQLSRASIEAVMGLHLMRARDRLDPAFGDPPPDSELAIGVTTAWDVYAVARLERLGYPGQKSRRLYHFRIRHGFSDEADRVFERLWTAEGLSWSDLVAASDTAAASRPAAAPKAKPKAARGRT